MSYYMSDFYRNPPAAYPPSGSARTTVPGWGVLPIAAGPARLAVGAVPRPGQMRAKAVVGQAGGCRYAEYEGCGALVHQGAAECLGPAEDCFDEYVCKYGASGLGAQGLYSPAQLGPVQKWIDACKCGAYKPPHCGSLSLQKPPGATRRSFGATFSALQPSYVVSQERQEAWVAPAAKSAIPWWVWVAAPGVLVGVAALAVNQGWVGGA